MFGKPYRTRLSHITGFMLSLMLVISGCSNQRILDYEGGFSITLQKDWKKLNTSETLPQVPWYAALSMDESLEDFAVYGKPNAEGDGFDAVMAITVSKRPSKAQAADLKDELKEANENLEKKIAFNRVWEGMKSGGTVPVKVRKVLWIFEADPSTGEIAHTLYHNHRYGIRLWENLAEDKGFGKAVQTLDLKAFGFGKGIGDGFFLGKLLSLFRFHKLDEHTLSLGFEKSDDFKVSAKIHNVFSYESGIVLGFTLALAIVFSLKCLSLMTIAKLTDGEIGAWISTILIGIVLSGSCIYVVYFL